jgi:Ca2+-binding EF-hand superfamily protein
LDKSKGVNKITFAKYYELPGIISERLYKVFDNNGNGYIDNIEFVNGMKILFTESHEINLKFIFDLYDFDKDGIISREDIRTVLSYVPLKMEKYSGKDMQGRENKTPSSEFNDQIESQNELALMLDKCFKELKTLDFQEFQNAVENISSDIYLFV